MHPIPGAINILCHGTFQTENTIEVLGRQLASDLFREHYRPFCARGLDGHLVYRHFASAGIPSFTKQVRFMALTKQGRKEPLEVQFCTSRFSKLSAY
jgi:hypothetical protein